MGPNMRTRGDNDNKNNAELESFWKRPQSSFFLNSLKTKRRPLYLKTQSVPRRKHF
jgi:hypothetical protein